MERRVKINIESSYTSRKGLSKRSYTDVLNSENYKSNISYFEQLLDLERYNGNSLKKFMETCRSDDFTEELLKDQWRSSYNIPITTKY